MSPLALLLACSSSAPSAEPAAPSGPPPAAAQVSPAEEVLLYGLRGMDLACAPCVGLGDFQATITASSTLSPDSRYGPAMALDGDLSTAWCEGATGPGTGTTLSIHLDRPAAIYAVAVWGGYFKSAKVLKNNHRLRTATLAAGGQTRTVSLADPTQPLATDPSTGHPVDPAGWFEQTRDAEPPWAVIDSGPTQDLTLTLGQVWTGAEADDTCISEVSILVVDPQDP